MRGLSRTASIGAIAAAAIAGSGCGTAGITVSSTDPTHTGAVLFSQRCSGCHTLTAAGTQGSGTRAVRPQGPNLDQRKVSYDDALYAIRNGGFSGSIMPQNIVVGSDALAVAQFIAKWAGTKAKNTPRPSATAP